MKNLEVTEYNREAINTAKQSVAELQGYKSWAEMEEKNTYDYASFSGFWEQVSILLSCQLTDHKEALKLWDPVNSFVQENADVLKIQIGHSIPQHVLGIVKKWHFLLNLWK